MALVHGALAWSGLPKGGAVATLHCDETFGYDDVDQVRMPTAIGDGALFGVEKYSSGGSVADVCAALALQLAASLITFFKGYKQRVQP
jgi:hypothetical protein